MLQKAEEQESEEANDDADINAEADKIKQDNNDMIISVGKEQSNLEYEETMKIDVEILPKIYMETNI